MSDLAPDILRQRLLIEGYYSIEVNRDKINEFLQGLAAALNLRTYGEAIIYTPEGMGKEENQGYDAFIPLIDSGISLYVWTSAKFMSTVLYTCKAFSNEVAIEYTKNFFKLSEKMDSKAF